jgi:hypothetical protein
VSATFGVSSLFVAVLCLGTASLDHLRDLVHDSLCDPVRGPYGDWDPLQSMELLLSRLTTTGLG